MQLTELRVDRLKRELGKLELPTTGTKNELQRRLRKQLQLHRIPRVLFPATSSGVDINSLLVTMMETQRRYKKLLELRTRSYLKLLEPKIRNFWLKYKKLLEPKIKNFWLNRDEIVNKQ